MRSMWPVWHFGQRGRNGWESASRNSRQAVAGGGRSLRAPYLPVFEREQALIGDGHTMFAKQTSTGRPETITANLTNNNNRKL